MLMVIQQVWMQCSYLCTWHRWHAFLCALHQKFRRHLCALPGILVWTTEQCVDSLSLSILARFFSKAIASLPGIPTHA